LVVFWMEVQLNMMLLPSITCVPHAAVRRNMHHAHVASQIKLEILEMTDAEGNACSVVPIHFQGRLHDLTQRVSQMLSDSNYWRFGSCVKGIHEDRQRKSYCENCAARSLPHGCQGRNGVLTEEDHLHWNVASCGKVVSSGRCAAKEMYLCQTQCCVRSSMHCL